MNRSLVICLGLLVSLVSSPARASELESEFLFELRGTLETPQSLGATPSGGRRIWYAKGGTFTGPRLKGEVVPGGGDWALERSDGAVQLDVRITLRTHDGALIYVSYRGLFVASPDVLRRLRAGETVDPTEYYFRTTPVFETSAEQYQWLNRIVAVGVGKRTATGVEYSIYAIK